MEKTQSLTLVGARVVTTDGADEVTLKFRELKNGLWPFDGLATLTTQVARGSGAMWVIQNFNVVPVVIHTENTDGFE